MMNEKNNVLTAYGRVNRGALRALQATYDPSTIRRIADELDAILPAPQAVFSLRNTLLQLSEMVHAIVTNTASSSVGSPQTVSELAFDCRQKVLQLVIPLHECLRCLEPLERLKPYE